ncbi:MAG: hypothetical protein M0R40_03950, partial [Firmicutes bacterium]|nr:hypothetical protein [Bacillota bacterium]
DISDPARTWSEPENTKIRLTFNATGTALEMCGTAKSSGNKDNFIGKMHDGIIFEAGKTYIFETEFLTNNANTRKELFRYGGGSHQCFLIVRQVSGQNFLVYPNTNPNIAMSASSYISNEPLPMNEMFRFTFVVDGSTRKYDFYLNGEKVDLPANNNIDGELGFAPLPDTIASNAPLRMYTQTSDVTHSTIFDNILAYKVNSFKVLKTNVDNFKPMHKKINVQLTDVVDKNNQGTVEVYKKNGALVAAVSKYEANVISLELQADLEADTDYEVRISDMKDLKGNILNTVIPFKTENTLSYLKDNFENYNDANHYRMVQQNDRFSISVADVPDENNRALKLDATAPGNQYTVSFERYIPQEPLVFESGRKYIFSARIKAERNANRRKMFVYGTGDNDYLFAVRDVGGMLAVCEDINETSSQIGNWSWTANHGWMDVMAVVDGETKTYNVFANERKINDTPLNMTNPPEQIAKIGFVYNNRHTADDTVDYYDDINIYTVSRLSRTYASVEDYDVVSAYEQQIRLSYNLLLDASAADTVEIVDSMGNTVECEAILDSADNRNLIINIIGNLKASTDYTIKLDGLKDSILEENAEDIMFSTDNVLNITAPIVTDESGDIITTLSETGEVTATVYVNKAGYAGDSTDFTLVIAYYKGTKLYSIDVQTLAWGDITGEDTQVSATIDVDDASIGNYVKIFTFNNLNDINPFRMSRDVKH